MTGQVEILVTLYIGLLLKFDLIEKSTAESYLFTALVVGLTLFVVVYPPKMEAAICTRVTRLGQARSAT